MEISAGLSEGSLGGHTNREGAATKVMCDQTTDKFTLKPFSSY